MCILIARHDCQCCAALLAAVWRWFAHATPRLTCRLPPLRLPPPCSIGLSNPAQGGGIVASANCAAEGPTTLHLHDPLACAAGLALARGQPLQTSLLGADPAAGGTKLLLAWTDVQQMVLAAPAVTHLLCMPFGILHAADEAAAAAGPACGAHSGSGKGALLFGFSAPPSLDARSVGPVAGAAAGSWLRVGPLVSVHRTIDFVPPCRTTHMLLLCCDAAGCHLPGPHSLPAGAAPRW